MQNRTPAVVAPCSEQDRAGPLCLLSREETIMPTISRFFGTTQAPCQRSRNSDSPATAGAESPTVRAQNVSGRSDQWSRRRGIRRIYRKCGDRPGISRPRPSRQRCLARSRHPLAPPFPPDRVVHLAGPAPLRRSRTRYELPADRLVLSHMSIIRRIIEPQEVPALG